MPRYRFQFSHLGFPSRASSPRVGLRERPLAIRALGEAALFQRLQRKGYGSIADVSACRPDMLGNLAGRKGALLAKNVSDRRADGLARLRLVACLRLAFWLWLWPRRRSAREALRAPGSRAQRCEDRRSSPPGQ